MFKIFKKTFRNLKKKMKVESESSVFHSQLPQELKKIDLNILFDLKIIWHFQKFINRNKYRIL